MSTRIQVINHGPYQIDFHGCYSTGSGASIAVIVLNRNLPEVTNRLCESILASTPMALDLYVTESGSDLDRLSNYCAFHFRDEFSRTIGLRIARGLNTSLQLISRVSIKPYKAYWFLTNDVHLDNKVDYASNALQTFRVFPHIGLIEHPHDVGSCFTLNFAEGGAQNKLLTERMSYPASIHRYQFALTPFAITRSIVLNGAFVSQLAGRVLDESNWRGWGADEDLGYRAWRDGYWVCVAPFHEINEDTFLTTRRSLETRTEDADDFKAEATKEMENFCTRKYNTDIRGLRRLAVREMLQHLADIVRGDLAVAHCFPGLGAMTRRMIEEHLRSDVR